MRSSFYLLCAFVELRFKIAELSNMGRKQSTAQGQTGFPYSFCNPFNFLLLISVSVLLTYPATW